MSKRFNQVLINPTEEEILAREPLMAFSFYLSGRNNVLLMLRDEIIELLDDGFAEDGIDGTKIGRASDLMWLWTLGAYEVIRTICQAKKCFSQNFYDKAFELKKELAKARMPAAKMEKQGKREPVNSNRSPDGWDVANKDLLITESDDNCVSARLLLEHYETTISSLTIDDVIEHHAKSYG